MKVLYLSDIGEDELRILVKNLDEGIEVEAAGVSEREEIAGRAAEFDAVIGARVGREFLEKASNLKYFIIPFAGIPPQDMEVLPEFPNITVLNSHFNAAFVAEHAWALLLAAVKRICPTHEKMRLGDWTPRYGHQWGGTLAGKTLLIIGYGSVGREVARIARAFHMKVQGVKRTPAEAPELDFIGTREDLPNLLPGADAIVVALPGSENTKSFIGEREFGLMKDGVFLVNVGRGNVIDEDAFYDALKSGKIGGAGIDTWWIYPRDRESRPNTFPSKHPLQEFDNLVFSPHRASHVENRENNRMRDLADVLNSIMRGEPKNVVSLEEGY